MSIYSYFKRIPLIILGWSWAVVSRSQICFFYPTLLGFSMSHSLDSVKIIIQKDEFYEYTFTLTTDDDYVWLKPLFLKGKPNHVYSSTIQPTGDNDEFLIPIANNKSNYYWWTKENVVEFSEFHIDKIIISTSEITIQLKDKDAIKNFLLKNKRHFRNRHLLRYKISRRNLKKWRKMGDVE